MMNNSYHGYILVAVFVCINWLPTNVIAEDSGGEAVTGEQLYFPCRSCHGDKGEGRSAIHAPRLAGQDSNYLIRQLQMYRDGIRGGHPSDAYGKQMALMAINYKHDAWIEKLTAYIATFPSPSDKANLGDIEAYAACRACHGSAGEGNSTLKSPRIAGLDVLYIETQLRHFRDGVRGYDPRDLLGQQMRAISKSLSDKDIRELATLIGDSDGSRAQ